jgi:hypothetical protein
MKKVLCHLFLAITVSIRHDRLAVAAVKVIGSKTASRKSGIDRRLRIWNYLNWSWFWNIA